jgi:hypothetical protein
MHWKGNNIVSVNVARRRRAGVVEVRRIVNCHIADVSDRAAPDYAELCEFICECGDLRCTEVVTLTAVEFRETLPGWVVSHDQSNDG